MKNIINGIITNNEFRELTDDDINTLNEQKSFFQSLIDDGRHGHATISIKKYFLPILEKEFPTFEFVPAFPFLEESNPSLEEFVESISPEEPLSDEERAFLRYGQEMLTEFAESMRSDKDDVVMSVYF